MTLVLGTLTGQMNQAFADLNPAPQIAASKMADAFQSYISSASNVGGGSFTSITGINTFKSNVGDIFAQQYPSGAIVGSLVATEFSNCLLTLQTVYQTAPPSPVNLGTFVSDMQNLFNTLNPSSAVFATNLAINIHSFCSSTLINGIIPGSPPIPFSGPII